MKQLRRFLRFFLGNFASAQEPAKPILACSFQNDSAIAKLRLNAIMALAELGPEAQSVPGLTRYFKSRTRLRLNAAPCRKNGQDAVPLMKLLMTRTMTRNHAIAAQSWISKDAKEAAPLCYRPSMTRTQHPRKIASHWAIRRRSQGRTRY